MASATDADKERLLSASSPDDLELNLSDAQRHKGRRDPGRWILPLLHITMVLGLALLIFIAYEARVAAVSAGHKGGLNPYSDGRTLSTNGDKFKIVLFSDLHYGERGTNNSWVKWADEADAKSTEVMRKALSDEHPDFVVYGGDQVTGENTFYNVSGHQDHLLQPVLESKTRFASIFGNHDESYNVSHISSYLHEKDVASELSWTQRVVESAADPKGQFNYYIPLWADQSAAPAAVLWFFDSRSGVHYSGEFGIKNEEWLAQDWVDPQAATWINNTADAMRKEWGTLPPALVFVHIPPVLATPISKEVAARPDDFPGINFDTEPDTQGDAKGKFWHRTDPSHPWWTAVSGTLGADDGLLGVISGHDHGDDWCGRADSAGPFTFCYARHTGYGGYGTWARGSRVFEFSTKGGALDSLRTWIRMEDHSAANTTTLAEGGKAVLKNSRDAPY